MEGSLSVVMDHLDKRWGVAAAWLFGSQTRVPGPGSDIDLAVLFQNRPDPIALLEARADLEGAPPRRPSGCKQQNRVPTISASPWLRIG